MGQRYIGSVAAVRNEDTTGPRGIVARIERMPSAAEIDVDPRGKIHGRVRRGETDISDITGAIARRDIEAPTESDRKMRVVAANPAALFICFKRRSSGAGVLIAEGYVIVYEVADGLNPRPAKRRM